MKAFNRTAIAMCLSLAILFLTSGSAVATGYTDIANVTLQIRDLVHDNDNRPMYDGSHIDDILAKNNGGDITMDASQFEVFYINTNDNTNNL